MITEQLMRAFMVLPYYGILFIPSGLRCANLSSTGLGGSLTYGNRRKTTGSTVLTNKLLRINNGLIFIYIYNQVAS